MRNSREEFLRESKQKKIICFGSGKAFKTIKGFLDAEQRSIFMLVDNEEKKWNDYAEDIKIESPAILKKCSGKECVILITSTKFADEIEKQLNMQYGDEFAIFKWPMMVTEYKEFDEALWLERIYKTCAHLYEEIALQMPQEQRKKFLQTKKELIKDRNKLILPRVPVMITTRCTLCCQECSNLMPYYKKPQDYPVDDVIKWIRNLCDAVDECICLELVGGEPFLYKELKKVLEFVLMEKKIQQVEFTTNGSILPKQEILELLTDRKVYVRISQYPNQINPVNIIKLFEENKIKYVLLENMSWCKTGELISRGRSVCELQSQFLNCTPSRLCRTILNGKLYVCSKAASLMELGFANNLEAVDLLETEHLRENISQFLQLTYSKACDYCDVASKDAVVVEPAVQVKRTERNKS